MRRRRLRWGEESPRRALAEADVFFAVPLHGLRPPSVRLNVLLLAIFTSSAFRSGLNQRVIRIKSTIRSTVWNEEADRSFRGNPILHYVQNDRIGLPGI